MYEKITCKHWGCGGVISKDHLSREHQPVCEKRTVSERKNHSFVEAAMSAPKRQDTFVIFTVDGMARNAAE